MVPTSQLKVNWIYGSIVIVGVFLSLFLIGFFITNLVYQQWSLGKPITGGWSWNKAICIDLLLLVTFFGFLWSVYRNAHTEINENSLVQPSLFGTKVILWTDVTDLKVFNGVGYHVYAGSKKIVVAPYTYLKPNDVIQLLIERIEKAKFEELKK